MDAKLLEIMVVTIVALLFVWLIARMCFRIMKIIVTKGPDFMKYLIIITGVIGVIWIYYNPQGAKNTYTKTKSFLFGGPSNAPNGNDVYTSAVIKK